MSASVTGMSMVSAMPARAVSNSSWSTASSASWSRPPKSVVTMSTGFQLRLPPAASTEAGTSSDSPMSAAAANVNCWSPSSNTRSWFSRGPSSSVSVDSAFAGL